MRRLGLVGLGLVGVVACSSVPFRRVDLVSLEGVDPEEMRTRFAAALPTEFRIVDTVTFEFKGRALAAIGYADVDTAARTFTIVGLHPAGGVKLFEVSGDSEGVRSAFAVEAFSIRGDLARAVGDDTRRIYFDRVPSPNARVSRERRRILFRQKAGNGEMEYVFAGGDGLLVEKRYYEGGDRIWSACYYEYRREKGKLYPEGVIFEHHEYGYRLVLRLREIRS
jgi:hypothetical protein